MNEHTPPSAAADYPVEFLRWWGGCAHLDCLPECNISSFHCERLARAWAQYQKNLNPGSTTT